MISIVTGVIGLCVSALIIFLIRQDRLHVNHGLGWLLVALGFSLLGFLPSVVDRMAAYFGIAYPPVLALTVGIAILVLKILLMDIERSRIEMRNQRLIQKFAMFESELESLRQIQVKSVASHQSPEEKITP